MFLCLLACGVDHCDICNSGAGETLGEQCDTCSSGYVKTAPQALCYGEFILLILDKDKCLCLPCQTPHAQKPKFSQTCVHLCPLRSIFMLTR